MKHDWNLTGARCSRARKKRRNNSNTLTDIVGSGNGHVVRVNAGTDGKGLGQLETAVGIVGQDKRATVLTTQDGKDAQSHVGHIVHGSLIEYRGIQHALRDGQRGRRGGSTALIVVMMMVITGRC